MSQVVTALVDVALGLCEPRILLFLFYAPCVHFAVSFYVFMMLSLFELIMDEE